MSPTIIINDKSQWRVKALNNKLTSIELANLYGGTSADYLVKYNQLLRKKIIAVKMNVEPVVTRIAKETKREKIINKIAEVIESTRKQIAKSEAESNFYQYTIGIA